MILSKEEVLSKYFDNATTSTEMGEHFFILNILLSKILLILNRESEDHK